MKKLPVFLVVMTLIAGSLFSAIHSHASNISDASIQKIQSIKSSSDNNAPDNQQTECTKCCHSGAHNIGLKQASEDYCLKFASDKYAMQSGNFYLPRLNFPPFQPPKA